MQEIPDCPVNVRECNPVFLSETIVMKVFGFHSRMAMRPVTRQAERMTGLFSKQALPNQKQDQQRQQISHIGPEQSGNFWPVSSVGLLPVILKPPAEAGHAEQQITEGADGQDQIADQKIFQIQNCAAGA